MGRKSSAKVYVDAGEAPQAAADASEAPRPARVDALARGAYRINSSSNLKKLVAEESAPAAPAAAEEDNGPAAADCQQCAAAKGLSAAHWAAYNGHLRCLEALIDPEAPCVDTKGRTPLFYACAQNRRQCAAMMLDFRSDWVELPDAQGDTSVHVASFFGHARVLELLLGAAASPHSKNKKGFKPAHVAANPACLELLRSYGDDLLDADRLGRTPLFVACATNRLECVEFLLTWDEESRGGMIDEPDLRGDHPLHAAACNGSMDCLRLLVSYGADVLAENQKGMRAVDLAGINHHEDCREMLAAEAERLVREWAEEEEEAAAAQEAMAEGEDEDASSDEEEEVVLVEDGNSTALELAEADRAEPAEPEESLAGESTYSSLTRHKSFVLLSATSVWTRYVDSANNTPFYFNNVTGDCQWDRPEDFDGPEDNDGADGADGAAPAAGYMALGADGQPTVWQVAVDPASGAKYYTNTESGHVQWEEPEELQQVAAADLLAASSEASRLAEQHKAEKAALKESVAAERSRQTELMQARLAKRREQAQKRREEKRRKRRGSPAPSAAGGGGRTLDPPPPDPCQLLIEAAVERAAGIATLLEWHARHMPAETMDVAFDQAPASAVPQALTVPRKPSVPARAGEASGPGGLRSGRSMLKSSASMGPGFVANLTLHRVNSGKETKVQLNLLVFVWALFRHYAGHGEEASDCLRVGAGGLARLVADAGLALPDGAGQEALRLASSGSSRPQEERVDLVRFEFLLRRLGEACGGLGFEALLEQKLLPLAERLAAELLANADRFRQAAARMLAERVDALVEANRAPLLKLYRHYASRGSAAHKMMQFAELLACAKECAVVPAVCSAQELWVLFEGANQATGNRNTTVFSFEKFSLLFGFIALESSAPGVLGAGSGLERAQALFARLAAEAAAGGQLAQVLEGAQFCSSSAVSASA